MKNKYAKRFFILALVILCIGHSRQKAAAQSMATVSFQVFYDALTPFGDWIHENRYGYVWVPADVNFHPYYTNGYWEMTIYGNTWVSLYPWGWAPFHYGRWTYDPFYGWIWIPGYQWAPAWVCWRFGGGYYGWAPLAPGFVIHVGFGNYGCPDNWWVFTPHNYIYGPRHSTYYVRNKDHERVKNSTVIEHTATDRETNSLYPIGPSAEDIKTTTGQTITVRESYDVSTADLALPTQTAVRLYRPSISAPEKEQDIRPVQFQNAPRSIRNDQPVLQERNTIPEYKKHIEVAPVRRESPEPSKTPVPVAPPVQYPRNERKEQPRREPTKTLPREQKATPVQQPRVTPGTTPVRPQQQPTGQPRKS